MIGTVTYLVLAFFVASAIIYGILELKKELNHH